MPEQEFEALSTPPRRLQNYSWTSDQYSQYSSKVVTATVRDATHTSMASSGYRPGWPPAALGLTKGRMTVHARAANTDHVLEQGMAAVWTLGDERAIRARYYDDPSQVVRGGGVARVELQTGLSAAPLR